MLQRATQRKYGKVSKVLTSTGNRCSGTLATVIMTCEVRCVVSCNSSVQGDDYSGGDTNTASYYGGYRQPQQYRGPGYPGVTCDVSRVMMLCVLCHARHAVASIDCPQTHSPNTN